SGWELNYDVIAFGNSLDVLIGGSQPDRIDYLIPRTHRRASHGDNAAARRHSAERPRLLGQGGGFDPIHGERRIVLATVLDRQTDEDRQGKDKIQRDAGQDDDHPLPDRLGLEDPVRSEEHTSELQSREN